MAPVPVVLVRAVAQETVLVRVMVLGMALAPEMFGVAEHTQRRERRAC